MLAIWTGSLPRRRPILLGLALVLLVVLASPGQAGASHFRGGDVRHTVTGATSADFSLVNSFRRCGYGGTAPDGCPAVGDVITEFIGGTFFAYGDGASTGTLQYRVDAINAAEDWLTGTALEPGSNTDTTLSHTYGGPGPFRGQINSCCTIFSLNNNANTNYAEGSQIVQFGLDPQSPVISVPPIVNVGSTPAVQTFFVPASDPGGQTLRWRLATGAEGACGTQCNPPNYSINANTGQVTWDTTGLPDGLWYSTIVVEALNASGTVVSDSQTVFLIRKTPANTNNPPVFDYPPTPPNGAVYTIPPGQNLTLNLQASDPDAGQTVDLVPGPLPPGATSNDTPGNPATGQFSFTPTAGQNGQDFVVNYTAQDNQSPPASTFTSFTVRVRSSIGKVSARGTVQRSGGGTATFSAANDCNKANSTRPSIVDWPGNRFTKTSVTSSVCWDDPGVPGSGAGGFDTQVGTATGTLTSGGPGTLKWTYVDGGPAASPSDKVEFTVKNNGGTTILTVNQQTPAALGNTPGGVWTFGP